MRIARIEQDGYRICIIDTDGVFHCFRIDKEIGAELVAMVQAAQQPPSDEKTVA